MTRDYLSGHWLEIPRCEAVIVDEAHRGFGNYKSKMHKALDCYLTAHAVSFLWLLTGTPYTGNWSVYSYGKLVRMPWKWFDWDRAFNYTIKMGHLKIKRQKEGVEPKLQALLRGIGTVIDLKDVAEVADDEEIIEQFEITPEQKKMIKEHFDPVPIVQITKQHQIESGVLKSAELKFFSPKDARVMELVEDNDKIIIVARYLDQLEKYEHLLSKQKKPVFVIRGGLKATASEVAKAAESVSEAVVLIQSDTCDGYNLKSFDVMVFASQSYSFVNLDQIKYRIKSMDKNYGNTYIYLIAKGIDQAVYDCVSRKQDFSETLYAKEKGGRVDYQIS